MPSSVRVGSRPPSSALIFSYSSGVRPCSRIISGVTDGIAEVVITGKFYCRIFGRVFTRGLEKAHLKVRPRSVLFVRSQTHGNFVLVVLLPNRVQNCTIDRIHGAVTANH